MACQKYCRNDYNNVDGLSGVMGDTKKVYVLQLSNSSSARKFTIKYRTVVENSSQAISYIAELNPRQGYQGITGMLSQVSTTRTWLVRLMHQE